jgi:hypothetical protein
MNKLERLAANASAVVSRMDDDELAMLLDILALVVASRGISSRNGFFLCAQQLRERADRLRPVAAEIFSSDCSPSPAL